MSNPAGILYGVSVWLLPVLIAITFHEAAHGWMARRLGDDTAWRLGRVTFNPVRHVDPVGTFLVPGLLLVVGAPFIFGWAKPVPVAFHRLNNPKRDMIWVALAGPGINILLALLAALALHLVVGPQTMLASWVWQNLDNALLINVVLACFNMLPLPPLDGGRVVTGLLPHPLDYRFSRIEPYGLPILLGVIFILPLLAGQLGIAINPLAAVLLPVVRTVHGFVLLLTGWI